MPRVIHFEIHTDDPERAVRFYEGALGWSFKKWEGPMDYWLVITGPDGMPGINGGLMRRVGVQSGDKVISYICTIDVPSLDDYTERVQKHGGQCVMPRMTVPGVGYLAYFKDTEGNIFGLMQFDPQAKM
jgi:predicted enzyme related to lactoylglutathione lyase